MVESRWSLSSLTPRQTCARHARAFVRLRASFRRRLAFVNETESPVPRPKTPFTASSPSPRSAVLFQCSTTARRRRHRRARMSHPRPGARIIEGAGPIRAHCSRPGRARQRSRFDSAMSASRTPAWTLSSPSTRRLDACCASARRASLSRGTVAARTLPPRFGVRPRDRTARGSARGACRAEASASLAGAPVNGFSAAEGSASPDSTSSACRASGPLPAPARGRARCSAMRAPSPSSAGRLLVRWCRRRVT